MYREMKNCTSGRYTYYTSNLLSCHVIQCNLMYVVKIDCEPSDYHEIPDVFRQWICCGTWTARFSKSPEQRVGKGPMKWGLHMVEHDSGCRHSNKQHSTRDSWWKMRTVQSPLNPIEIHWITSKSSFISIESPWNTIKIHWITMKYN